MSRPNRKFYRTSMIGLAALAVLVWAAIDQFGISPQEMVELFLGTVVIAGGIIVFAALFVTIWIGLRKWLRRGDSD